MTVATQSAPAAGGRCITLGISAKSLHATRRAKDGADFSGKLKAKADRYHLQRIAQGLLYDKDKDAADQHRVCWCHRSITSGTGDVGVYRAADGSGSRLAGVSTCGSVWHCPVCAAKIAEQRREELSAAMAAHIATGGSAYLVTLTFPHEADHDLAFLLERMDKARTAFKNSRTWKRILGVKRDPATGEITEQGQAGCIGVVTSLEVTVSLENGWHPHLHLLVMTKRQGLGEVDFMDEVRQDEAGNLDSPLIQELKAEWVRHLFKAGLGDQSKLTHMMDRALNVRGGEYAAQYIAKFGRDERWGASSELTRSHAKIGAAGRDGEVIHFTPFQLLIWASNGDGWAIHRFKEYAGLFSGKRMLTWSKGLRKQLLKTENELSDEEAAAAELPEEKRIGEIDAEGLKVLVSRNRIGDFLRYVAEHASGQQDIDDYLAAIAAVPVQYGGALRIRSTFGGGMRPLH